MTRTAGPPAEMEQRAERAVRRGELLVALEHFEAYLAQQPDGSFALAHTGLTDLRHALTVTDTASGAVRIYHNATSHPTHAFGGSAELPH